MKRKTKPNRLIIAFENQTFRFSGMDSPHSFQFIHFLQKRLLLGFAQLTRLEVDRFNRSVVFSTATSLSLRDGRHRRGVDLVDARGKIRGNDPRRTARSRSSWLARRQVVTGRVMTGLPIAMLTKRTAVPSDPTAAASLQSGPTTIPTTLERARKIF